LKNTVRFHENNAEPRQQHSVKYSTCRPNTYQSSTLRNHGLSRGITSGSQNMVNFCQPLRSSIDSVGYRSSQSTDETADYRNRPTSPPLKYSPSEDVFNPTKTTQQVFRVSKKAQVEEDSPTGSDVDAVISKEETKRKQAETRQTTLPRHHFSPSSPTLSERTRRPSGRIFKNFGRSEDPPSPLTYPRPHNSAVKYCITSNEESDEKDEKTRISQVAERPKILATRGVRPFRGVSAINAKGVSSPSGSSSSVVTVDSSVGEDGDIQRGRWVFPGKRTIYSEESQQAQYEMRSNLRVKDCPSTEVKRPPHHYTGPWMFKGLSPRLSIPNEISRERRNSCSGSSKPLHFCHATQSDPPQAIMVDRMVSPISSPPPGAETACGAPSISTLGRTRTRNRSGLCTSSHSPHHHDPNDGSYSSSKPSLSHARCTTYRNVENTQMPKLGASRISLWSQNTSAEQPKPQRFGSLGRHDDMLIRKYLQRHATTGSKVLLHEPGLSHTKCTHLRYNDRDMRPTFFNS
uniref:SH2 domain-containing protein n=1 Tax=Mesocestoides corti TaxID=53468 RepID=A0A5K3EZN3_MESCO